MSTYYGYVCKSHTPNLPSEHWFNHGDKELARAYELERAGKIPNDPDGQPLAQYLDWHTAQPIYWLRQHPNCIIAIQDEYGRETPLPETNCRECRKCAGDNVLNVVPLDGSITNWWNAPSVRMIVCPGCGNKRCPRASWHGNDCTGSNEPDQEPRPALNTAELEPRSLECATGNHRICDGLMNGGTHTCYCPCHGR